MTVEFLRTTAEGQQVVGRVRTRAGRVDLRNVPASIRETLAFGVTVGGRVLTTADGDRFLRALPAAFSGSYLRARLVE